ncbi:MULTISPECIES: polysaccharide biosynthesis/export family protein [Nonlabens]|uniref:polysaccharide biosynthesis/export family protein n=1 Tax=Nonlabens TaxID=363408 RepID=UPI000CF46EBD|nr:polysaccharide biosynthesis/export family protein [Nonlabens tegetincola]PQJ18531.1 hypothetical protein BST93_08580 [Nonlabens tegetincola]
MKIAKLKSLILLLVLSALSFSCTTRKQIVYVQDINENLPVENNNYEVTIKPDDLLRITVTTDDMTTAQQYNKFVPAINQNTTQIVSQQMLDGYLVKPDGTITFPELGEILVKGKTLMEVSELLTSKLSKYLKQPDVEVRLLNFKFTVIGEVNRPGTYDFKDNRISLIQALGYAGDLTIDGRRDEVLIIRDNEGNQETLKVDLTSSAFINSEAYYLEQNDTVIVQPNGAKASSGGYTRYAGVFVSIASLVLSVIILITRNN